MPEDSGEFSSDEDDFPTTRSKVATMPADAVASATTTEPALETQERSLVVEEAHALVALSGEDTHREKQVVSEEEESVMETSSWFQQRMIEAGGFTMRTDNCEDDLVVPEMRSMRLPKSRGQMLPLD